MANTWDTIVDTHDDFSTDNYRDRTRGLRDMLGLRPKRPPRPEEEGQLLETAQQERTEAGLFSPLVKQRLADIADTTQERRAARGVANADVMQQVRGGSPFDRAMTRGKALSRVAAMGEQGVVKQNMRDRIGMARFGQGLRSGNNRDLGALSELSGERTAMRMRENQSQNAMYANVAGTLGGIGLGMYQNRYQGTTFQSPDAWGALDSAMAAGTT